MSITKYKKLNMMEHKTDILNRKADFMIAIKVLLTSYTLVYHF